MNFNLNYDKFTLTINCNQQKFLEKLEENLLV